MSDIQKLPAQQPRVETGLVQFGDDWTGIFIRGDSAFGYALALKMYLDGHQDAMTRIQVEGLLDLLTSSDERTHV
jgi:hypothetical protein